LLFLFGLVASVSVPEAASTGAVASIRKPNQHDGATGLDREGDCYVVATWLHGPTHQRNKV